MDRRPGRLHIVVLAGLTALIGAGLAHAGDLQGDGSVLPRAFQKARLGMTMDELIRTDAHVVKTAQEG